MVCSNSHYGPGCLIAIGNIIINPSNSEVAIIRPDLLENGSPQCLSLHTMPQDGEHQRQHPDIQPVGENCKFGESQVVRISWEKSETYNLEPISGFFAWVLAADPVAPILAIHVSEADILANPLPLFHTYAWTQGAGYYYRRLWQCLNFDSIGLCLLSAKLALSEYFAETIKLSYTLMNLHPIPILWKPIYIITAVMISKGSTICKMPKAEHSMKIKV